MNERVLRVHNLPSCVRAEELAGSTVVVIDVLRATSTICQALASGARDVVPFLEVEKAIAAWAKEHREEVVLGGERGGKRIDGFDLGNSPAEYTRAAVAGKQVLITTTNGTRAMHHARQAGRVVLASFLNLSAVALSVQNEPRVDIVCAGTDGEETGEDIWAAGAIVSRLCGAPSAAWQRNDSAAAASRDWNLLAEGAEAADCDLREYLASEMRETPGGRNLVEIGMDQDVVDCARIDRLSVVPELDMRSWRITAR